MGEVDYNGMNEVRFRSIDKELERHEKKINEIDSNLSEVTKLSTLMELQIEMNRNQDQLIRQQGETLGKINENLTSLNNVTVNLDNRIGVLEENLEEESDKNKIDLRDLGAKIVTGLFFGAVAFVSGKYGIPFLP